MLVLHLIGQGQGQWLLNKLNNSDMCASWTRDTINYYLSTYLNCWTKVKPCPASMRCNVSSQCYHVHCTLSSPLPAKDSTIVYLTTKSQ